MKVKRSHLKVNESCLLFFQVRSHSNISFKSEDNNLEKEILAGNAIAMQIQQEAETAAAALAVEKETEVKQQQHNITKDVTDDTATEEDTTKVYKKVLSPKIFN